MTHPREDLWPRLASLPLSVASYDVEPLRASFGPETERVTLHVRLRGAGTDGLGEDIFPSGDVHDPEPVPPPPLPLAGDWTLEAFCDHVASLDQWAAAPRLDGLRPYRNWAFESAALDLALRQAGQPLHAVLGLEPRPVRFVDSLGLGDPPSMRPVHDLLEAHPGLRFKLDAEAGWSAAIVGELAATGAVETLDFKGRYGLEVEDGGALLALYDRLLAAFPAAVVEDPHDLPEVTERVAPHRARVAYDAPIHSAADVGTQPVAPGLVNVKPSRIARLRPLFGLYAHCSAHGLRMYGGGMGEIGVGRGQVQLLASLFHPDAPNDIAPPGFHLAAPPAGLPASPLAPRPARTGFRRDTTDEFAPAPWS